MSFALYKMGIKRGWKIFLIMYGVLAMYLIVIVSMFNPEIGSVLSEFERLMPELMSMAGMSGDSSTMIGFLANYLYGFVMLIFPMVFSIIVANQLVAHHVDCGSMAYLLSAPVNKVKIIITQMMVLISGITLMIVISFLTGLISCEIYYPGELDISTYVTMNVGTLALQLFIGAVCFLSSCIFNESKHSLGFGAGITSFAYILQMMANTSAELENIKYFTFFTLFAPKEIAAGDTTVYYGIIILLIGAVILYCISITIFNKKDIPV